MTRLTIMRNDQPASDQQREAARAYILGALDGFTEDDKRGWRKFWRKALGMEPGELLNVDVVFPRNWRFHKKFFALLTIGFEAWEPSRKHKTYKGKVVAKRFEQFREDVTILAGWYEQTFDLDGRMKLRAKSISFAKMEQDEFEHLYSAVASVLLDRVLVAYSGREELDATVEKVMGFI